MHPFFLTICLFVCLFVCSVTSSPSMGRRDRAATTALDLGVRKPHPYSVADLSSHLLHTTILCLLSFSRSMMLLVGGSPNLTAPPAWGHLLLSPHTEVMAHTCSSWLPRPTAVLLVLVSC